MTDRATQVQEAADLVLKLLGGEATSVEVEVTPGGTYRIKAATAGADRPVRHVFSTGLRK